MLSPTGVTAVHRLIYLFFFISGFSSLVFEILWERMLRQVFGTSSFALSTLLTAFMGGLALGSWLAGRYTDRLKRPLRAYGLLEGGIGLYAFLVPLALDVLPAVYDAIFDFYLNDFYLFSLLRFVAAFAILIFPTTLMGATLPIVSQWVSRRQHHFQGSIGFLYGLNTFGACSGTLLAGFILLPTFGLSTTNTTFAFVNLALCFLVLWADHAWFDLEPDAPVAPEQDGEETEIDEELDDIGGPTVTGEAIPPWLVRVVLATFAVTGAISMSYQVLWTRAYVIILGSSTYSFTLILTAFLIGLGGGSALLSSFVQRIQRPVFWIALVQLGVAAAATVAFFFIDNLPAWLYWRFRAEIHSVYEVYIYYFFLVGLVVLIPTILQGMTFPLVVRAVVFNREESGRQVGNAYSFNTAGSIVGSFAAGFILLVLLGLYTSMWVVIGINLLLAALVGLLELVDCFDARRAAGLAAAALVAAGIFGFAPTIDRSDLTRGMFRAYWAREYSPEDFRADDPEMLYYQDGLTATVSVEKRGDLTTLKANGKPEASDGADMSTQILVGLLPYVVRSGFDDVAVGDEKSAMIGYGSGVTAGAALQWPLEHLECIEIEPAMVEASTYFDHVNHEPLQDERLQIVESDGRNYLEYTDQTYDVVVSEPSNPWIAGVASLFTVDHFEAVKSHLAEDGVFAQWVQLYEMRPENVRTILATFLEVFPHVHAFSSKPKGTDLILIASKQPVPLPPEGYERAWNIQKVQDELKRADLEYLYDIYGLTFMSEQELREFAEGAPLNTDDNGLLEFEAPKDLIRFEKGQEFFAEKYFQQDGYGDLRPYFTGWPDGDVWTAERIGRLARGTWRGGKPALAEDILEEAGYPTIRDVPRPLEAPFDPLEEIQLVRHARSLDLAEGLLRTWPTPDSDYHRALARAIDNDQFMEVSRALERERKPDENGYSGERGLLYAYLLYETEYYAFAERQLERLVSEANPDIVGSFPFLALRGAVEWERRDYDQSWKAYLAAGKTRL